MEHKENWLRRAGIWKACKVQQTSCNIFDPIFNILGGEGVLKSESLCYMGLPLRFLCKWESSVYILHFIALILANLQSEI